VVGILLYSAKAIYPQNKNKPSGLHGAILWCTLAFSSPYWTSALLTVILTGPLPRTQRAQIQAILAGGVYKKFAQLTPSDKLGDDVERYKMWG